MKHSNSSKNINMDLEKTIPLLKVLDSTTGLLQFSHLSFQEALAVSEAQARAHTGILEIEAGKFSRDTRFSKIAVSFLKLRHAVTGTLKSEAGQFLRYILFSKKAANFLKLCPDDVFHLPKNMGKNTFHEEFSPQDFLENLGNFVRPCKMDTLRDLDLSSCSLKGAYYLSNSPLLFLGCLMAKLRHPKFFRMASPH